LEGIVSVDYPIVADLRSLLPKLIETLPLGFAVSEAWVSKCLATKQEFRFVPRLADQASEFVNPFKFSEHLMSLMDDDGVVFADTGANLTWVMQGAKPRVGQRIISAWGNSPMGYAVPAAIGGKLAEPRRQVVATIGDGGFQMNIQELQTIVGNSIDIKVFVFNNKCLGNIKMGARREFDSRVHGNDASTGYTVPDFVEVAKAYGLPTRRIQNDAEASIAIREVLDSPGPVIVDVNIHPDQEHDEIKL
jgi:acetolactate synthase-1/2/3 large subunit